MPEPITDEGIDRLRLILKRGFTDTLPATNVASLIARIDAEKALKDRYEAKLKQAFLSGYDYGFGDGRSCLDPDGEPAWGEWLALEGTAPPVEKEK